MEEIRQIADRDPLTELHEQERKLLWSLRNVCRQELPHLLPKLLQCVEWDNRGEVSCCIIILSLSQLTIGIKCLYFVFPLVYPSLDNYTS